jgi:hypothetical protein
MTDERIERKEEGKQGQLLADDNPLRTKLEMSGLSAFVAFVPYPRDIEAVGTNCLWEVSMPDKVIVDYSTYERDTKAAWSKGFHRGIMIGLMGIIASMVLVMTLIEMDKLCK